MIYRNTLSTRINDFDVNGNLNLSAILVLMENIGDEHSTAVTTNTVAMSVNGIAWILSEWRVEIIKHPTHSDKPTFETWVSGSAPTYRTDRNFTIKDENGNIMVKGVSQLALFNLRENTLVCIDEELMSKYQPEEKGVFEKRLPKLRPPKEYTNEIPFPIRKTDMDYNGHVHNTDYLKFALEALPDGKTVSSFRIAYYKPVKFGNDLTLKSTETADGIIIGMYSDNELYSLAELKY